MFFIFKEGAALFAIILEDQSWLLLNLKLGYASHLATADSSCNLVAMATCTYILSKSEALHIQAKVGGVQLIFLVLLHALSKVNLLCFAAHPL